MVMLRIYELYKQGSLWALKSCRHSLSPNLKSCRHTGATFGQWRSFHCDTNKKLSIEQYVKGIDFITVLLKITTHLRLFIK